MKISYIIFIIIIIIVGIIVYFIIKPKSNEKFIIKDNKNPFKSKFLFEFIKKNPDLVEYKKLHQKQKEYNKKETFDGETNLNQRLSDYLDSQEAAASQQDKIANKELMFKTFGIPGTILGDSDGLKVRELITNILGNAPDQLSSYLFKFLQTKKKKDVMIDLLRYVGITAVSMTLAAVGLGPLSSLFKGFLPIEDDTSINLSDIENTLTESLYKERFLTLAMNMNLNLQKIKYFMTTVYLPLKVKYYASCNFDEDSEENIDIIKCIRENKYDPNIIKTDLYENENKRELLNESLKEMDKLMYSECTSIYSDIQEVAITYNFGNSIEIAKLINNIHIQMILIEISYFQEKALVDNLHKNSNIIKDINKKIKDKLDLISSDQTKKDEIMNMILPSCKTPEYYYINPWVSKNIGNIEIVDNSPQNSGLLQTIQKRCKEYFDIIQKTIQLYYNNLEFYNDCNNMDYIRWIDHYDENIKNDSGEIIHYKGEYKSKKAREEPKTNEKGNISNAVHFTLKKDLYIGDIREKKWWERKNYCTTKSNYYTFINKNEEKGDETYKLYLPDSSNLISIGNDEKRQAVISDISYYYTKNDTIDNNKIFYNNRKCGCLIDFIQTMNFEDNLSDFLSISGISELPTFKNYFKTAENILKEIFTKDPQKYSEIYRKWGTFKVYYYNFNSKILNEMDLIPQDPTNSINQYALKNLPLYYLKCVFNRENIYVNADLRIKDLVDMLLKYNNDRIKYDYKECYPFGKNYGSYFDANNLYNSFKNPQQNEIKNIKNFGTYCSNPITFDKNYDIFNNNLQIILNNSSDKYPGINENIFCQEGNALITCSSPIQSPGLEGSNLTRNRELLCYNEFTGLSIKNKNLLSKYIDKFSIKNEGYGLTVKENENIYDISNEPILSGNILKIPDYTTKFIISDETISLKPTSQQQQASIDNILVSDSKFIKLNLNLDFADINLVKPIKPSEKFIDRDKNFYIRVYNYMVQRQKYYEDLENKNNNINDKKFIENLLNNKLLFSFIKNTKEYIFDIQNGYLLLWTDDLVQSISNIKSSLEVNDKIKQSNLLIKYQILLSHIINKTEFTDKIKTKNEIEKIINIIKDINLEITNLGINDLDDIKLKISDSERILNTIYTSVTDTSNFENIYKDLIKKKDIITKIFIDIENKFREINKKYNNIYINYKINLVDKYLEYINKDVKLNKLKRKYENLPNNYNVLKQPENINNDYVFLQKKDDGMLDIYNLKSKQHNNTITNTGIDEKSIKEINNSLNIPLNIDVFKDSNEKLQYRINGNFSSGTLPPSYRNDYEYYIPNFRN